MRLHRDRFGSLYNQLTRGCELCAMGAKLVLFAGGRCPRECWYCPVSIGRGGDTAYANERRLRSADDLLAEASDQGALGTGVTGGEPLLYLDRVEEYVGLLKSTLGEEHHVHLYTGIAPTSAQLDRLGRVGVDELRLHPPPQVWKRFPRTTYARSLLWALDAGMDAGVEVPALRPLPDVEGFLFEHGGFLILNELEFSESNAPALGRRGYRLRSESPTAAIGSAELGRQVVAQARCRARFCPSAFKDGAQLRERFRRTAARVRRPYERATCDGTLVYGMLRGAGAVEWARARLPPHMYRLAGEVDVEVSVAMARRAKRALGKECEASVAERHPVKDGIVVEQTFL